MEQVSTKSPEGTCETASPPLGQTSLHSLALVQLKASLGPVPSSAEKGVGSTRGCSQMLAELSAEAAEVCADAQLGQELLPQRCVH